MSNDIDGAKPAVTFGSYVIAKSVREDAAPDEYHPDVPAPVQFDYYPGEEYHPDQHKRRPAMLERLRETDPRVLATGAKICLTFFLGVSAAMYFGGSDAPEVAEAAPAQAADTVSTALNDVVSASLEQSVTRIRTGDLIAPSGITPWDATADLMLSEVLRGLTAQPVAPHVADTQMQNILSRDTLRMLRDGVLAGNYTIMVEQRNGQDRLCLRLFGIDVSEQEAADLIEQAAARGDIALPASLLTAEGSYDADTLIFNLVQTSLANDGTAQGARAAKEMSRRAFAASNAQTRKVDGDRIYTVQPGDSLAYLSLQFYGRPSAYQRIFQANSALMEAPDQIQIGQRLIIPG